MDKNTDFIFVYGSNDFGERKDLQNELDVINENFNGLWCIWGDFNGVINESDRINGKKIIGIEIVDMYEFVIKGNFIEMKIIGGDFIWLNGYVLSNIDRVLSNVE